MALSLASTVVRKSTSPMGRLAGGDESPLAARASQSIDAPCSTSVAVAIERISLWAA